MSTSPETITSERTIVPEPSPSKFISHMKQYPVAVDLAKLPGVCDVTPVVQRVGSLVACETTDKVADGALSQLDRLAPCLKTTTLNDVLLPIKTPFTEAYAFTASVCDATKKTVDVHLVQPTKKASTGAQEMVAKAVYNEEGKNKILSPLDPLFAPINRKLGASQEFHSSELHRCKMTVWNKLTGK